MSSCPNLTVANLQTISRKHRPWLIAWEMGWSLEKIAATWSTETHPLSAADIETALDDLTQQPLSPVFSEQSMFQCRVDHAPEVTCAQFREETTRQGWTVESLTERFRTALDRPHETIKRILTGAPVYQEDGTETHNLMAEVVIPYACLIGLYHASTAQTAPPGLARCLCGCSKPLRGKQKYATQACRNRVSRKSLSQVPGKREAATGTARSVTIREGGYRHSQVTVATTIRSLTRADGSIRDIFTDKPAPALLQRAGMDCKAHNDRTILKGGYREIVRERPDLFE